MANKQATYYFQGINGLRFFAALAVVITHIELLKPSFYFETNWHNPIIFNLGGLGVYFFFVLSGFLITFLLLKEKEKTGTIDVKKFYLRRILRIWPLYYFIVILGFFILPNIHFIHIDYLEKSFHAFFTQNLWLYTFILPNLALAIFPAIPHIGQLWSIGVEEQFYILWPLIIRRSRNVLKSLFIVFFSVIIFKVLYLLLGPVFKHTTWYEPVKLFIAMSKFECMAIGGIGAFLCYSNNQTILTIIRNKYLSILSIPAILLLIYSTPSSIQDGIHLVYSILFLLIIIQVAHFNYFSSILENKVHSYLGKISYGIYMYHFLIIPFVLYMVKSMNMGDKPITLNIIIYTLSIGGTVIVSGLSFRYFENWFINLKEKYAVVKSKF